MKRELGKLLKGVREEQKIEKEDLCSGLCTVEELDRIDTKILEKYYDITGDDTDYNTL